MREFLTTLVCLELILVGFAYILPDTRKCTNNGREYLVGDEVHISSRVTCVCLLTPSTGEIHLGSCAFGNRSRRQGFPTPAPPSTTVKHSTKSPPPFTTRAPPDPKSTKGPSPPSTRGTTLAPPPIG
ncbi:uncharacterized protein LOC132550072 [Ylistrum balloti]|uniref:uncharacterized protein LOC132550072 n=1 Tax=Ylistrum balloti TaxID=509963 RepID=UPI002905EB15|nr:uncharacterized protein LOC132550072 [Ylistrum balloti]